MMGVWDAGLILIIGAQPEWMNLDFSLILRMLGIIVITVYALKPLKDQISLGAEITRVTFEYHTSIEIDQASFLFVK